MTRQEAVDYLEKLTIDTKIGNANQSTSSNLINMSMEALEKQIPQEPFEVFDDDTCLYKHFECPSCGDRLSRHAINSYCMKCGQLIKWVKEGEE